MKSIQLFEKFLVETGLNDRFLFNLRNFALPPFSDDCPGLDLFVDSNPVDYVSIAFVWRNAPEGVDYWYLVDATWIDLFKGNLSFDDAKARIKAVQNLAVGIPRVAKTRIKVIQNLAAELLR